MWTVISKKLLDKGRLNFQQDVDHIDQLIVSVAWIWICSDVDGGLCAGREKGSLVAFFYLD
jgi:hypothetical protein